jgi:hypothetical protein
MCIASRNIPKEISVGRLRALISKYEEPFRRSLLWIALYYLAGRRGLTAASIADADLWWHLRVGEWIAQHHWVPYTDSFSSYGMGRPWAAYSWLFEVLVFELNRYFGLMGVLVLIFVFALLITWVLHGFISAAEIRPLNSILLTGVAVFAMAPLFTPRPWLFTLLLFLLELQILVTARRDRNYRTLFLLPIIFAIWANVHIQFLYGLVVLALFTAEGLFTKLLTEHSDESELPLQAKMMSGVFLLCVLATIINPYHVHLYSIIWDTFKLAGLYDVISELRAMEFRSLTDWFVLVLSVGAAFALGRARRRTPLWILLLLLSVVVSFRSRRDVWFCVLTAVTIISYAPVRDENGRPYVLSKAQTAFVMLAVTVLLLVTLNFQKISQGTLQDEVAKRFPVAAANVVADKGYAGPLFNDFNWGGYLMWRLPQLPVAIDGRSHLHDAQRVIHFDQVWEAKPNWREVSELKDAQLVIAEKYAPLTQLLRQDQRFKLVYEDEVAVVFIAAAQTPETRSAVYR